ncbi:MAG TPA: fused MFS/spermidine synthase, partial [Chloroflexota bacterium]|nr:fused MFS/spermidine synthase [Chloroflexota bacterium]
LLLLSALPSSLLLSVTHHISNDVAAVPLLWVIPLALYVGSFVLAFATRPPLPLWLVRVALPFVLLAVVVSLALRLSQPVLPLMVVHLAGLFALALLCHGEIAAMRPPVEGLTAYYFWISLGGVLGGAFGALVAPLLFPSVVEYPLALLLASLMVYRVPRPSAMGGGRRERILDVVLPLALAGLATGLLLRGRGAALTGNAVALALVFGPLVLACLTFRHRPLRFTLGAGAILLSSTLFYVDHGQVILTARSFFGVHRVRAVPVEQGQTYHILVHGNTVHGMQAREGEARMEPLTYYHRGGPAGQLFSALRLAEPAKPVAVVGLGTGGMACYGAPGQRWDFYEIDPLVERVARDPRYFTFLRDCPPQSVVTLGDGRLALQQAPPAAYATIVLDAYNSDAIPLHLITREAVQLYLDKLLPEGVLVFHISNRHLDLAPVLGGLASDADLICLVREDASVTPAEAAQGKSPSRWAVMARRAVDLGPLLGDARWRRASEVAGVSLWTDDYVSILPIFRWG